MPKSQARTLAKLLGTFHNITYYAPQLRVFADHGIDRFWHSYMAYRAAPMGRVEAPVVTATFYNFAPALVRAAVPRVWQFVSPEQATQLRSDAIASALGNIFDDDVETAAAAAATTILEVTTDLPAAGRALFGSYRALTPPEQPLLRLWHASTLWREYRGDGHNIVLAAEGIDGIECHVLLAGRGIASQSVIQKIRGWDAQSWRAAHRRLAARGLVDDDGRLTQSGATLRSHIEERTDVLAQEPLDLLGTGRAADLMQQLEPIVDTLVGSGAVPGKWPPPAPPKDRPDT